MPQGDPLYLDYGGSTDRHISLDDTLCLKVAKRPGRPKKCDAERVRNSPVNDESWAEAEKIVDMARYCRQANR